MRTHVHASSFNLAHDDAHDVAVRALPVPGRRTLVELVYGSPLDVQLRVEAGARPDGDVHAAARLGVSGAAGPLPFLDRIQQLFGRHDVSQIRAHTDRAAADGARAMGAEAFATGDRVAFAGAPTLHTAAHEAAHVIQQRAGVQLKGGVGAVGDAYERHADEVADRVIAGQSASDLLDRYAGGAASPAIQRRIQRWDGKVFDNVADVAKALAISVSEHQRGQIAELLNDELPHDLADVRRLIGAAPTELEPSCSALRDKILNTGLDDDTRGRAADDLRYQKDVTQVLGELLTATQAGPWEVVSQLLYAVAHKRMVELGSKVASLLPTFASDPDAYAEILDCLGKLDPTEAWWGRLLLAQADETLALKIVEHLPDGEHLADVCVQKLLALPVASSDLKLEIANLHLGSTRSRYEQLLASDLIKQDQDLVTALNEQLAQLSSADSSDDEPKPIELAKHTPVRINPGVSPVSTGTGANVGVIAVAGRLGWIHDKSFGNEYEVRLDDGEIVDLDADLFTVVQTVERATNVVRGLERPTGPRVDPPRLARDESGNLPYDEHPKWPGLEAAFTALGFAVKRVYDERKQHVVVRAKRNVENTSSAIVQREVHVGKGKTSTTYSDLEHELSHAQQQDSYAQRGGYKPSVITLEQGFRGDEAAVSELSTSEDAYGEMHAYMQEFIRLTARNELVTAGESVATIKERVSFHRDKISAYSVDAGDAQLPGFRQIARDYEQAVAQYEHDLKK